MNDVRFVYHIASGRSYRLEHGRELSIGRAFDNQIIVDDISVSRHHARVGMKENKVYLKDLRSTNGTHVNGELIWENCIDELKEFDEFLIGSTRFKILDEDSVIARNVLNRKIPKDTAILLSGL